MCLKHFEGQSQVDKNISIQSELKSHLSNVGGIKWNSDNYLNEGRKKEQLWLLKAIFALNSPDWSFTSFKYTE